MFACFGKTNKQKKYKSLPKQERWIEEQAFLRASSNIKHAKPVPLKPSSPAAAAAAAAARHEVQVSQLEAQVAGHQRDLQAARTDLQHAARCFDAAMVMVNYISKEYNPFQLTEEVKALQTRATEIQLKLDEAAATQRRLEETLNEREAARQRRETEHESELSTLKTSHEEALQARQQEITEVRDAWHRERELQEAELVRQQEQRDQELRSLAAQHQQTLSSVAQQWEKELSDSQQRALLDADQLRAQIAELQQLNEELARREEELKAAMGQSTNTKIQVLSARVKEKEKDVRSLNAVLELKKEEITALRRDQHELQQLRDHKAKLEENYTKALAKAEDLEAQLRQRCLLERQLSEENARLKDYQDRESKANKRLSMENEQLQYKLSEISLCNSPGALSRSASFRSARTSVSRMCSSDSAHAYTRVSPRSPLKSDSLRRRSRRSEEASPPPQVTAVVEKSDSISWVLDLERSPSRRGSSTEPDDGAAAGDSSALKTYTEWRRSLRGASHSPPSANGASVGGSERSESSDSELADQEQNGVFYQLGSAAAAAATGTVSAPSSLAPAGAAPVEPSIAEVPESGDGTEI